MLDSTGHYDSMMRSADCAGIFHPMIRMLDSAGHRGDGDSSQYKTSHEQVHVMLTYPHRCHTHRHIDQYTDVTPTDT